MGTKILGVAIICLGSFVLLSQNGLAFAIEDKCCTEPVVTAPPAPSTCHAECTSAPCSGVAEETANPGNCNSSGLYCVFNPDDHPYDICTYQCVSTLCTQPNNDPGIECRWEKSALCREVEVAWCAGHMCEP